MADDTAPWEMTTHQARALALWAPPVVSADADVEPRRNVSTGRSRELSMESAFGANALRIHRDNVVGIQFTLQAKPLIDALGISVEAGADWARMVEREWYAYANSVTFDCDASRVQTFPWLMHTAYSTYFQSGEAVATIEWKESAGGYNTCMLLIEPDRLSQPMNRPATSRFRRGIETDRDGAPLAYHIRVTHPSDARFGGDFRDIYRWRRVPRQTQWGRMRVLHMIDRFRPDMRRGITTILAAIAPLKMLDTHALTELEASIVQAGFAATITSEMDTEEVHSTVLGAIPEGDIAAQTAGARSLEYMQTIAPYYKELRLRPGGQNVVHLLPGEKLEMTKPNHPGLAFEAFQQAFVRRVAAAVGVSTEQLSRDFSKMSFASARQSLTDIWRHFLRCREMIVRQLALPFYAAWLEEAIDTGRVTLPDGSLGTLEDFVRLRPALIGRSTFVSWGQPSIDPVKEVKGREMALASRLTTLADEAMADGRDSDEILEQTARERARMKALGIPLPEEIAQMGRGAGDGMGEALGEGSPNE